MTFSFIHTFSFADENPFTHSALQDIHNKVLEIVLIELPVGSQWTLAPQMMTKCYKVSGELDDEDDPRVFYVPKSEGSRDIEAPKMPCDKFKQLLKIKKVNIGTIEDLEFSSIGDY